MRQYRLTFETIESPTAILVKQKARSAMANEVKDDKRDHVTVHVTHVNDVKKVNFHEPTTATLQNVWDDAYNHLNVVKDPKDIFQTAGKQPKSLLSYLPLTLHQAEQQKVIDDFKFEIVKETGGA